MEPPLIPFDIYDKFAKFNEKDELDHKISFIKNLLKELPTLNYDVLDYMCGFLKEVSLYEDVNKMNANSLGTCCSPNYFKSFKSKYIEKIEYT